ncbi:hypothetical protein [Pseudotabrizicola algicola]|uniref:HPt domain-containing protein n=1 Tax=Pseudotabrizicola algicola TaxID=2709381 RepID=A0A6B3RSS9_9RHOB|nr:hypothetical protein [Pseudotabrizicola algicola]NEX47065.1 hypothetical protein [Pseudotabrizicola algicola]
MADPISAPPPDLTPHLRVLRAALARLAATPLTGPARAALAEAEMALAGLESAQAGAVDRGVFEALLAMAGPEVAPELVAQMATDLHMVATGLTRGLAALDWAEIRGQTHVLVALAGSAGAQRLEQAAQALNMAAHETDAARARALAPGLLAGLDQLIGFVETARAGLAAKA